MEKRVFLLSTIISLFVFSVTVFGASVSDCMNITTPDTYDVTNDILDKNQTCISILADDVYLDCHNYNIDGTGITGFFGINAENSDNVTIIDCNLTDWGNGTAPTVGGASIRFYNITNSLVENIDTYNAYGVQFQISPIGNNIVRNSHFDNTFTGISINTGSNNINITGVTVENSIGGTAGIAIGLNCNCSNIFITDSMIRNTSRGIFVGNVTNVFIINNTIKDNLNQIGISTPVGAGISISNCTGTVTIDNNTITGHTFTGPQRGAISVGQQQGNIILKNNRMYDNTNTFSLTYTGTYPTLTVYNNFINTTNYLNISGVGGSRTYDLNTTGFQSLTNIVGGGYIGGNYWGKMDGTGYSDTCTDANTDGYCDNSFQPLDRTDTYTLGTDYLPLSNDFISYCYYNISTCQDLVTGNFCLQSDITDFGDHCFKSTASNVNFDCLGHTIDGIDSNYAFWLQSGTNITIRNCILTDWQNGIWATAIYLNLENMTSNSNTNNGFNIVGCSYVNATDIVANDNGFWGFTSVSSSDHIYLNNIITNSGVKFTSDTGILSNSISTGVTSLDMATSQNLLIYNNILNGSIIFDAYNTNYWNTTYQAGTNIWNASLGFIGGNLYTNSAGNGFSDTCDDLNADGFCDDSNTIATGNTDYFPLKIQQCVANWTASSFAITCFNTTNTMINTTWTDENMCGDPDFYNQTYPTLGYSYTGFVNSCVNETNYQNTEYYNDTQSCGYFFLNTTYPSLPYSSSQSDSCENTTTTKTTFIYNDTQACGYSIINYTYSNCNSGYQCNVGVCEQETNAFTGNFFLAVATPLVMGAGGLLFTVFLFLTRMPKRPNEWVENIIAVVIVMILIGITISMII